jgi:PTH1 family peptidyl-tRNA hydrolase
MNKIIVGLGNPGKAYEGHRHNVEEYAVRKMAAFLDISLSERKDFSFFAKGEIQGTSLLFCCPSRYMNLSGEVIGPLASFYKSATLVVVHDELDLPLGVVRYKEGGGTGGHNGLKSIHARIGPDYDRIRIGIGRPPLKEQVSSYVLSGFSQTQQATIDKAVDSLCDLFPFLCQGPNHEFIQRLHTSIAAP